MIRLIQEMKQDKIIVIAARGFNPLETPLFDEVITMSEEKIKGIERV
jgi:hypothetical protein